MSGGKLCPKRKGGCVAKEAADDKGGRAGKEGDKYLYIWCILLEFVGGDGLLGADLRLMITRVRVTTSTPRP